MGIQLDIKTVTLDEDEFEDVCQQVFDYCVQISPVDKGYFVSQWEMDIDYPEASIYNETPYAEPLDEGWSKQAPNGIIGPATRYLQKLVRGY